MLNSYSEALPPPPPPHLSGPTRDLQRPIYNVPTGMDNFGENAQRRGPDWVGQEVADRDQQFHGMDAARGLPPDTSQAHFLNDRNYPQNSPYPQRPATQLPDRGSYGSGFPLSAAAATPGVVTPHDYANDSHSSSHSTRSPAQSSYYAMGPIDPYGDSPYQTSGLHSNHAIHDADILPHNIADDGDDGFIPDPKRRSMLPHGRDRSRDRSRKAAVAGGTAATGAGAGVLGGLFGRKEKNVVSSGSYNAVPVQQGSGLEKSEWLSRQTNRNNKMRWIVGVAIGSVVVLALIGGIVGGVLGTHNSSSSGSGSSSGSTNNAATDTATNGDLDINSAEIKGLMDNKNLHKVFPGMDYTPWGTQYPLCLTYPPSQNNVTRDMAVISQLTNAVRLYGTDCNQTEMVLHAIDRLKLTSMKVWLGVWIDTNTTTTQRQLDQMYKILADTKDRSIFKGVIVGNEALYRAGQDKATTEQELITTLNNVRSNFTNLEYDLSISTSDLGDNWNAQIAQASDYVMSNIHPFFAGVDVSTAAAWTWNFWQTHDVTLQTNLNRQVISETGWPSGGGTDCGNTANVCTTGQVGAVASVDNMNKFMADWVCQALANGTEYFWFEAFDEAWKITYNEPGKEWEDKCKFARYSSFEAQLTRNRGSNGYCTKA